MKLFLIVAGAVVGLVALAIIAIAVWDLRFQRDVRKALEDDR
jgi:hypothetical protein